LLTHFLETFTPPKKKKLKIMQPPDTMQPQDTMQPPDTMYSVPKK